MIVNKHITVKEPVELEIKGITLLSKDEYRRYMKNIPHLKEPWWLRSPHYDPIYSDNYHADFVYEEGNLSVYGADVSEIKTIRPALKIYTDFSKLKIGDVFEFKSKLWTIISGDLAICNTYISTYYFRRDYKAENANIYEASDIKKYIEDWFNNEEKNMNKLKIRLSTDNIIQCPTNCDTALDALDDWRKKTKALGIDVENFAEIENAVLLDESGFIEDVLYEDKPV